MNRIRLLAIAVTLAGSTVLTSRPAAAASTGFQSCGAVPTDCTSDEYDQVRADANADCGARDFGCFINIACTAYISCGESYINTENWQCVYC